MHGYFKVFRPELADGEHKFYLNLTEEEELAVLEQFGPVILEHVKVETIEELIQAMEPFRQLTE